MSRPRIAVTGMGVVCSIARNQEEFAVALQEGRRGIGHVDFLDSLWTPCKIGGEVKDFEPVFARELSVRLSRADALAVSAAAEALEQSALGADARQGLRIGSSMGTCQNAISELGELEAAPDARYAGSPADAVALMYELDGPRVVASNACSASASAITAARDLLWDGAVDVMLAGGSDGLAFFTYAGFSALKSLDMEACSPYGRSGGLTIGEGAAVFVLETFEHAQARGATILAELAGCGGSADAYHPTAPDPTGRGAALAMRRALRQAGIEPTQVDYVNGHGTGTPSNDTMERAAFRLVFGEHAANVPISSTKSMIGHTLGAAGAVEAVASVLAMRHGFLPPTVNMPPDAPADFDFVPEVGRTASPRVVISNNYAFGGANASLVFTDPAFERPAATDTDDVAVLVTGLGAVGALGEGIESWLDALVEGRSGIRMLDGTGTSAVADALGAEAPKLDAKGYASRSDWRKMNDFARMGVAAARLAWNDAGMSPARDELDEIALVFATAAGALRDAATFELAARKGPDEANPNLFPHVAVNAAAGHVCTVLGIHGPVMSFTQGGVSSLVAVEHAAGMVRRGEIDVAIVLGADELCETTLEGASGAGHVQLTATAVRPLDAGADGTAFGSAAVAIVLESAAHAAARGARAYAELVATAIAGGAADAHDPVSQDAWESVLRCVAERAGVRPREVGYCVSAASGVSSVDAHEISALATVFGDDVPITAPKAATGECLGADAAINVLVGACALRDGRLFATANVEQPATSGVVTATVDAEVQHAIVTASSPGMTYGALVLRKAGAAFERARP